MIIKGIYAASMSLFNEDLSLNVESTIQHSERLIEEGCHGAAIFGSTGQAQLISTDEKKRLIEKLSDSKMKDHFIIGTGDNALYENVELIKHTLDSGSNKFLLGVPAYYKFEHENSYKFFATLFDKVPEINVLLYNFEKLFGYKFEASIVEKLAKDFSQIKGVKDSSYNLYTTLKMNDDFLIT